MAGGLGSRFWPISTEDTPKQLIDVMGNGQSMLQTTFDRFTQICMHDHIVVVTGEQYYDKVREQLPNLEPWQVLAEPMRRNTAPCIAYAAAIVRERDAEATVIVSPSDHAIFRQDLFVADLKQAVAAAAHNDWIITLGVQPTHPDTSYGYIQFRETPSMPDCDNLHPVVTFTEKPPVEIARQMIASGEFFWNTGLLVWRLPVLLDAYRHYLPDVADLFFRLGSRSHPDDVEYVYSQSEAVSIDHGIMEKADNVHVLAASFGWSDVETWNTLYDASRHDANGNAILGNDNIFFYNTHNCVIAMPNESGKSIVVEGLDGYIVAADSNTLMICRRSSEDLVFKFASDVELKKLIDNKRN